MKRRVLSLIIALALCLNLCPMWAFAADNGTGGGLCPHHPAHTDECGYREPTLEQACTHIHDDGCYITETDCIHQHTAECYLNPDYDPETDEPDACAHVCTEDGGCVARTLSCLHEHDDTCGYAPADPGAACTFVCRICPIDDLIGKLPAGASAYNSEQVQAQLIEIYALYDRLSYDEQQQVDLSRCAALQEQIDAMGIAAVSDVFPDIPDSVQRNTLTKDTVRSSPFEVARPMRYDTDGYTLSCPNASAMQVTGAGQLYLTGTVTSGKGAGVEVQSGGFLSVRGEATAITGKTYALDIASGATVQLAAGTYTGGSAAIRMAGGDFADLLAPGYAFFDGSGNPILSADAAAAKTLVVKQCTDHANKTYVTNTGAITHTWTCQVCKAEGTEPCTFTFDENGKGTCALCGNEVTVMVNRDSLKELAYDTSNSGNVQPANGTVTVTAKNGTPLTQGADYTVGYSVHADVGNTSVTVTVTVVMGDNKGTFTKGYTFTKDELTRPVLEWDTVAKPVPVTLPYDGGPVEASELPPVTINIKSDVDLHQYLQYSYKAQGDSAYTDGLPTNAGTYDVVVSLPEKPVDVPDYEAASSEPITLIINKISPILTPPAAIELTFDRTELTLVTAGALHSAAARDGVVIKFAIGQNGAYSTAIPTGINAGEYDVWYQTEETENFLAVGPLKISGVEIQRKPVTPIVTLSEYTYLYTGGYHQPDVEVRDEDNVTVLLDSEYAVEYVNNRNVSTDANPAKVVVTDKSGGNYAITKVEVQFKITLREQETLSITNKPDTVAYGDEFTLSTLGGSGNGNVTWEVVTDTGNDGSATINATSGRVKITGAGTITVKATKSGVDPGTNIRNYDDATAIWTFTADKKPVVATVTAEDKNYNGDDEATIHAVVEQGVLPGDEITITGLTGEFNDANAGVDKPVKVTVDPSKVTIQGANSQHYDVSYSSLTVTATIRKAVAKITTPPEAAELTYDGNAQKLIDARNLLVDPSGIQVEYAMSKDGPYSTDIPERTNAGTYTVWYRVQETPNYTGLEPESIDVEIKKKLVTPAITLSGDGLDTDNTVSPPMQYYIYDGTAKEPAVTLEDENGNPIPADEYTVAYSNNTNVGTATVTVKAKDEGNYSFSVQTKDFRIDKEKARVVTAPKMAGDPLTYNTRAQQLVTEGTGSGGTMVYALEAADGTKTFLETIPSATNAAEYTVYYKVKGDDNHSDSDEGQVIVTIAPKTVKDPTIDLFDEKGASLVNYTYDGNPKKPTVVVKDGSTVIGTTDAAGINDEYNVVYTDNVDAGKATVSITDKLGGNYTITGSKEFVIVKADIVFNPAPEAAVIIYDGQPHELLNPGATSGGEVLYALDSPTTTYTAAIPQATEAGDYVVYYKVTGDKNHNDLAVKSVPVTIQRKPLTTITIELAPDRFVYDGQVKLPEVTVKDGKTVLPEEEYTWKCTQSGTEVAAPANQGIYTIEITDASGGNYDLQGVTANTKTFTIGKATQAELVIDHSNAVTTNYGDRFALSAGGGSSTSGVEWSVTSAAATVDADTGVVEITGVGEVTITATKPGDDNYLPVSAQWTFTAAPKPVTASITVADRAYDGTTDAAVASAVIDSGDLVNSGDDVRIDKTSITAEFDTASVGTDKTVTLDTSKAKVGGTDAEKYAISYPLTVTAEIERANTTITTQPAKIDLLTYNGQPQALVTAGKSDVGFVVYSLNGTDFSPEIPTGTDAKTYEVYYKVAGTADYTEAPVNAVPITVTIAPKTISPVIDPAESSYLYDGAKHEPKITVKDGKTVIDENQYTITWANDDTTITDDILTAAGSYTATITNVSGGNYLFTAKATVEIVPASQAALNITGQPEHVYYGDKITTLSTSGGSGNGTLTWSITSSVTNSTINSTTGELIVKDTGSITVKAERAVPNYGTVSDTWTFTVEPKPVMAEVTVIGKVYDGSNSVADGDIKAEVKESDLVNTGDSVTISGLTGTYDNANVGTNKTVTLNDANIEITTDPDKYTVVYPATAKADITARPVDVTVTLSGNDLQTDNSGATPVYSYEYDGTEKTPTVTVTGTDAGGYSAMLAASDYTFSYANNKNVGTASVTVKCAEGGNYDFGDETVYFAIESTAAKLTSTPQAKRLTYNGTLQDLVTVGTATGGTVVYSLSPIDPDDKKTYSEDIPQGEDAGVYTVYYMVKGDDNHEDTGAGQMSVTIDPKEITPKITLNQDSYVYSGSECKPTVTVEDGNTEIGTTDSTTGENSEYSVSYRDNINAGMATVIVSNKNGGNYIVNGTSAFTIGKADLTAADITDPEGLENLPYNGAAQALIKAGNATGGTMVYSLEEEGEYSAAVPTATAVGPYTVYYKVQGDGNHNDTEPVSVDASIIVNTVNNPTIQVEPEKVNYTGEKQAPAITVKDENGVVINGSEYEVTYTDADGDPVTDLTNAGKYTVTITGVQGGNYTFDTTDGKNTADFEILLADQEALTITGTREQVYYGDKIQLGATGGNGTVSWKVDDGSTVATIDGNGLLKITGVGSVTVTATSEAFGYTDQTATWRLYADQKPVTAVVTAASKEYDGETDTTVTATLQASDLVNGDVITIKLSGEFEDPSAGTDKKVIVDSTSPDFTGSTGDPENYKITYPATTTASILKADIEAKDVTAPAAADAADLVYTGTPLALVEAGAVTGGTMEYSTDGINFSASLPTGINADDYDVWYRVKGDGNHNDVDAVKLGAQVTIARQEVTDPTIEFSPNSVSYDGAVHKPTVVVKDNNGRIIPDTEYSVEYSTTSDWKTAGDHTVTVKDTAGGNYDITNKDADFTILMMGQNPLSIGNQPGRVQYGDTFTLNTTGGSGTGKVTWDSTNATIATVDMNSGLVTVVGCGRVEIRATKEADDNYGAVSASWTFSAEKKAVTPIVTAKDREYIVGNTDAELVITWKDRDLVGDDNITLNLTGTFNNANVGTDKTVTISGTAPSSDKYDITIPPTTTASITPKAATATVVLAENLEYTGSAQNLVSSGSATGGDVVYSLNGVTFTRFVPTGTNAGTYTFWYKALADENYKDSAVVEAAVTIAPKPVNAPTIELDPDTFEYDGTAKKPDVTVKDGSIVIPASEYTVKYSNNTAVGTTAEVTIDDAPGGNYIVSGTATFTITAGAAKLTGAPQAKNLTYNGNPQELVTDGAAVNGEVVYSLTGNDDYTPAIPTGINAGTYSVYYKVKGANGAADTAARVVYVTIQPKSVTPNVFLLLAETPAPYTGTAYTPSVMVSAEGKPLTKDKDYSVFYSNNTNPGTAMVLIWSIDGSNYQFSTTTTFEIVKKAAKFIANPAPKPGLVYDGTAQELVIAGTVEGGTAFYSLDGVTYSGVIPTGTETKQYTVFAKVVGDSTHADSDPVTITAEIKANEPEDPTVVLTGGNSFSYTGGEIKPTVTVYDDSKKVIPATEYTVSYSNNTNVGKNAAVTVTGNGKNYSFTATAKFEIVNAGQPSLEITGKKDAVYYGDTLSLGTTGGTGSSVVTWTVEAGSDVVDGSDGQYKIIKSGMVTIKVTKAASTGYEEVSDTWTFFASPKPVEAVVTAADKDYDGKTDATLNVAVTGLVNGDTIPDDGIKAEGKFTDERVGADKTVIVTLTISDGVREKYDISYPATIKASITQAPPEVTAPTLAPGLTYNGTEQALLTNGGTATGGNIMYSLDGGSTYSFNIPTAKDAGNYTIWYKAVASDENHKDTAPALAGTVTIAQNTEKPSNATCSPNTVQYSGAAQTPAVDVLDSTGRPIPAEEYTVTVVDGPAINPGTYTASIKDNPGGNYEFSDTLTADFEIVTVSQNPLTITDKPVDVHYGDKFSLSAVGGSGSGKIVWSIAGDSSIAKIENGVVTVTGTGAFTVEAYREAWGGYGKSNTDRVSFYADPKPITPVVTAANKRYDGTTTATLTAKFKDGDLVGDDEIELIVGGGTFETENVGTNTVLITPGSPNGACGNYYITWPESTTASISRVKAEWDQEPEGADLTYTGDPLPLLTAGATLNGIGKVEYSASQYGRYSEEIPVGINADTYTVWYRVADDVNYQGIAATSITVEIKQEKPRIDTKPSASGTVGQKLSDIQFSDGGAASVNGKFAWKDGTIEPPLGQSQQEVIFTPDDTANYETVTFQITVTITNPSGDTPGDTGTTTPSVTPSEPNTVQTTVQNGTASAVVSTAAGARLVKEAVENQSQNIVIKPEITGDVTKTEVSIPASTVSQIKNQTNAALTVSAPIADVTIPNEALDTLSRAGGTVNVVTEQAEQAVVLTVTAGGKTVDSVPGGLTLTVPAEDAGPGTVAVLVHEDGTRETVQKSVVEDGKISVPLSGSATVEIVDNSKEFTDVSPTSWEADAVAFASAHELFSGTSETTFSPNESMSRGMLATVLYRLEGCPDQEGATTYGDVSSDAWYADGVAWVTENGIANGYGDGQFGPNDNITREQFAVMLWNYAGRPAASSQVLDFTDADQAGSYALEALCWAAENGILNGYSNGQLVPGGTATRAQAAQMLKNFMENT